MTKDRASGLLMGSSFLLLFLVPALLWSIFLGPINARYWQFLFLGLCSISIFTIILVMAIHGVQHPTNEGVTSAHELRCRKWMLTVSMIMFVECAVWGAIAGIWTLVVVGVLVVALCALGIRKLLR